MDETKETEVLNRTVGIKTNTLPTGRKLGVEPVRGSHLYCIKYVDNKAGDLPDEYNGRYTGIQAAQKALEQYVTEFWDMSDNVPRKTLAPKKTLHIPNAVTG